MVQSHKIISVPEYMLTGNTIYQLALKDPKAFRIATLELERQVFGLEMIASESNASVAALGAASSVLTNKYAEGYPGDKYYGGCKYIDEGETLAIERAKTIFGAKHANVQPNSGTQANQAVFFALMNPQYIGKKGKILSLHLDHGGHLSHGSSVNATGAHYDIVYYTVNKEGIIDLDTVLKIARKERPDVIVSGGSAYPRIINFKGFREIADEVNAYHVSDMAHISGLVAAGLHPSPVNYAHATTTTTQKTLGGPRGGIILLGDDYETMIPWIDSNGKPSKRRLFKAIDSAVFPGYQGGPLEHIILAKAVAFGEILNKEETRVSQQFIDEQKLIIDSAQALASVFLSNGFRLASGGTDNHLMLVKRPNGLTGYAAQEATEPIGITINKNLGPDDDQPAKIGSYVRIGTPANAGRGVTVEETKTIGNILTELWNNTTENNAHKPITPPEVINRLKPKIDGMVAAHPIYQDLLAMHLYIAKMLDIKIN